MQSKLTQYALFENDTLQSVTLLKTQGFCNENYLLKTSNNQYLLRKFKLENNRKREFKVQKLAYKRKIAAKPHLLDDENGLMICDFIEGDHKETLNTQDLKKLSILLQKLHKIQIRQTPIDLKKSLTSQSKEIQQAFQIIQRYKVENVLCHNDLNPKNILFSAKEIKLIDWEFATTNDRYFDLASICVEFELNKREENTFLEAYFGKRTKVYKEKLDAYKVIYKALCAQWFDNVERES
ncbi:MAG: phosphotransferase family protein [Sulfurovum sp.]|nr:phosphotransferase family protein [Sulfurovum sp.]NNJ46123.1 phosphotransferase family protein [Sulfurovum sp.]